MVADAVGSVAEQAAPQLGMIAVAHDDEVIAPILGEVHDDFGGVTGAAFAVNGDAKSFCQLADFAFAFLEIIGGGFIFALGFAGQVGVLGQRLAHPERRQLSVVIFGGNGGAFERGLSAF